MNENEIKKYGLKVIGIIVLIIGIGYLGYYMYINYLLSSLSKDVKNSIEKISERSNNKNRDEILGNHVNEITINQYLKYKKERNKNLKITKSDIQKTGEEIKILTSNGIKKFTDNFDKDCMTCIVEHEIVGEVTGLNKIVIETGYFRFSEFQVIDLKTGQIDTIESFPNFLVLGELVACSNDNSKDKLNGGLQIYKKQNKRYKKVEIKEGNWVPIEINWIDSNQLIAKVHLIKEGRVIDENFKYVDIKI